MPRPDLNLREPIPVSLITGFLGSGKTTLLNHLLASPEMDRTAVIINEFGEVGIDHLMIVREIDEGTVLLKSGCICCTVQGELVDGLKELYMKRLSGALPPFTRVAIETTGLADPLPIVTCLMRDPLFKHVYRLDSLVTTVDAVHGEAQLDRHAEAVRQAAVADRLVITKPDLAGEAGIARLHTRLEELNPGSEIIVAMHGCVTPDRLFNTGLFDPLTKSVDVQRWLNDEAYAHAGRHAHTHDEGRGGHEHEHGSGAHDQVDLNRHDEHIASFCLTLEEPLAWEAFKGWYEDFAEKRGDHILRVKGIVNIRGENEPFVIHCVQSMQHLPQRLPAWPGEDRRSRIVFITHDLPRAEIEASLRQHLAEAAAAGASGTGMPEPAASGSSAISGVRWLNEAELGRLFSALSAQKERIVADALRLMLLTGVSCEDVRTARWEEFDLDRRLWLKPVSAAPKSAIRPRPRRIPLGDAAMMLIQAMRERGSGTGCVFAAPGPDIPVARLDAVWAAAAGLAGIENTPLEALRPVLAAGLFRGLSPALTRRLLGLGDPDGGEA